MWEWEVLQYVMWTFPCLLGIKGISYDRKSPNLHPMDWTSIKVQVIRSGKDETKLHILYPADQMKTDENCMLYRETIERKCSINIFFFSPPEYCLWSKAVVQGLKELRKSWCPLARGGDTLQNRCLCCFAWEAFRLVCFQLHFLETDLVSAHIRLLSQSYSYSK